MKLHLTFKQSVYEITSEYDAMAAYTTLRKPVDDNIPEHFLVTTDNSVQKGGSGSGNFDHSGRPGEVGGSASSATADWLTKNTSWDMDGQLKMYLCYDIGSLGLNASYFYGLKGVTDKPVEGHSAVKMKGLKGLHGYAKPNGSIYGACYEYGTRTIHINQPNRNVFLHELAHNIWNNKIEANKSNKTRLDKVYQRVKAMSENALEYYGLRKYSQYSIEEFFADSFAAYASTRYTDEIISLYEKDGDNFDIFG